MADAHRVEVTGPLHEIRFPNVCASCGAARPAGDARVEKMFRRTHSEHPTTYHFAAVHVPLCRGCLTAHERDRPPVDEAVLRRMRRQWALKVLPYVLPMGVQLFMVAQFGPKALSKLGGLTATPRQWDALIWLAPTLLFAGLFVLFVRMSLGAARPLIGDGWHDPNATHVRMVPGPLGAQFVVPEVPTPTLAAIDFGDEQFEIFAPNRRGFAFRSAAVAEQFAALNANLVWDAASPRAVRARRLDRILVGAVIAVAVVAMVVEWLRA